MSVGGHEYLSARDDFFKARRRANLREALSFLRPGPGELLNYDEVRTQLKAIEAGTRTLEEIPLDRIVGSEGRYDDFTRGFLPRRDSDVGRWTAVRTAMTGMEGVPPIEVYRLGDVYFVKDGNHRVSVARQLGSTYIQAYVTPVYSKVELSPDTSPEELILKAQEADFLIETRLDELRPEANVRLTEPGGYEKLLEHISVHRYYMGIDEDREVSYPEAVAHWYDAVYMPVVRSIRRNGLLRGFPGRTEADLYLWLAQHRAALEEELGYTLEAQTVAHGVARSVPGASRLPEKTREEVLRAATRQERTEERICQDVLVALPAAGDPLAALPEALNVCRREGARLYGLYLPQYGFEPDEEHVRLEFDRLCEEAAVPAQFAVAQGTPYDRVLDRASWCDLVVVPRVAPAGGSAVRPALGGTGDDLPVGFRSFLRRSPRPVLAVAGPSSLSRALLIYDGSERSEAALFVAAYACAKWGVTLHVVAQGGRLRFGVPVLQRARDYLERHGITATYEALRGGSQVLLETAREREADVILMGSYRYSRVLEEVVGGALDETLRRFEGAVLIT